MSLFDNFFGGQASMKSRSIGSFVFDVTKEELHESKLRATENPVESGANIADHAVLEPKEAVVRGIMVSYEAYDLFEQYIGDELGILKELPLPLDVIAVPLQAINAVNRVASEIASTIGQVTRPIAPWLPDGLSFLNDISGSSNRVSQAYNDLLMLQRTGEPIEVSTGLQPYQDMLITSVGVAQKNDDSAEFIIGLREIFIVETMIAGGMNVSSPTGQGKSPADSKKKGRSETQSSTPINNGRTIPKKQKENESILSKMGGAF